MKLHSIRHGQTVFNSQRKWQGWLDSPLTELGRQQARESALRLIQTPFDQIIVSPLGRALETLDIILAELPNLKKLPVLVEEQIKERNVGHVGGIVFEDVLKMHPEEMELRRTQPLDWDPEGGESSIQFVNRIHNWAKSLNQSHVNQNILSISHGGVCGQLHAYALGLPPEEGWSFKIPNASISEYENINGQWRVLSTDLTSHNFQKNQRIT